MSNSIAPGSSADVNVRVTALTANPNVPVTYKTVILKKNLVNGVNTLTQEMMSVTNTKYVIKYDYVLSEDITIPENCTMEFDGGSIQGNHSITFDNTTVAGFPNMNVQTILGTIHNKEVHINWFFESGADISDALQLLIAAPRLIHIDAGLWFVSKSSKITSSNVTIKGDGPENTTIKVTDAAAQGSLWMFGTDYEYEYDVYPYVTTDDMDIKIRNFNIYDITFNTNRGNLPHSTISPQRFYVVYLKNSENCTISNCKFIDAMTYESNNGEPAITTVLCNNIKVSGCYSSNITLVGFYTGINCKAIDNEGYNSVGTWIETARGYGHIIDGNKINGTYWNVSIIGVNCHDCVISNNIIEQEDNRAYTSISGLTLGHAQTLAQAERSFIKNNRIITNNASYGILVQCNSDEVHLTFENNYIEFTLQSPTINNYAITCSGNNILVFNNNHVISNASCVTCSNIKANSNTIKSTYNSTGDPTGIRATYVFVENNSFILEKGIGVQSLKDVFCIGNSFKDCCIHEPNTHDTKIRIENNVINLTNTSSYTYLIQVGMRNGCYPTVKNNIIQVSNDITVTTWIVIAVMAPTAIVTGTLDIDIRRYINNNIIVGTLSYSIYVNITDNSANRGVSYNEFNDYGDVQPTLGYWGYQGKSFFNRTVNKPSWGTTDKKFVEADGAVFGVNRSGAFASKPAVTDIYVGFKYFCTDKPSAPGSPIYYTGDNTTPWVYSDGTAVS